METVEVSALRFWSYTPAATASALLCLTAAAGSGLGRAQALSPPATRARACVVPGAGKPLDQIWRPNMRAALAYARRRTGDIAFAVRTPHRFYGYRPDHVEWSASVVKAMLMVAYLDRPSVARRPLNGYDTSLLVPMITHSDNNAASAVDGIVGNGGLQALANRVGMTHFRPVMQPWGETQITARDQTKFFLHIDAYIAARHRSFGTRLLASITPSQRWGIGTVAPHGWGLFFKGGWGSGTGLLDHQVVLLTRGCARVSLTVLSMYDGSHAYGKETLAGIFSRLLEGFPTGVPLYPVVDGADYSGFVTGDASTGRSEPGSSLVDSLSFHTTGNGRSVRRFAIVLANDPKDLCPAGKAAGLRVDRMKPDPDGRFGAHRTSTSYSYVVNGQFLARRRASGTLAMTDLDPVTHQVICEFRATWRARAVNH